MGKGKEQMEEIAEMQDAGQPDQLKNIIEAAIVFSDEPLTIDRMLSMFSDETRPDRSVVKDVISELEQDYASRGLEIKRIDKGYRLQTRQEYSKWLTRLTSGRPPRYSRALLETLAIIAYRQPVTRGEIEEIRGVAVSTDIIRTLLEREWVRQVGFRDVPGKPALFATTKAFLEYFNLESLSQLPPLMEIRDMDTIAAELNMTLPLDSSAEEEQSSAGEGKEADDDDVDNLNAMTDADSEAEEVAEEREAGAGTEEEKVPVSEPEDGPTVSETERDTDNAN
jgi:segregation and condensation protein B